MAENKKPVENEGDDFNFDLLSEEELNHLEVGEGEKDRTHEKFKKKVKGFFRPIGALFSGILRRLFNNGNTKREKRARDIIIYCVCLLGAFGLWFYVMNVDSPLYQESFNSVSVEVVTKATDGTETPLSAISGGGAVTDITLQGKKTLINALSAEDIHAYIDVSGATTAGRGVYPIVVDAPEGTTVVDYSPKEVTMYLDKKTSKNVPVSVEVINYTLNADMYLGDRVPSLENVTVTGPENELTGIAGARITLSPGGTVTRTFTGSAEPVLINEKGEEVNSRYVSVNTAQISATVKVMKSKQVPLKVSFKNGYFDLSNVTTQIEPSSVIIRGEVSVLDTIESLDVMTIDETTVDTFPYTRSVKLSLPEGVTTDDNSRTATVTVNATSAVKTASVLSGDIAVINAPDDITYTVSVQKIKITLRGVAEKISALTSDTVSCKLDLSELSKEPGSYQLPVSVSVAGGDSKRLYVVGEYTVTVTVS